MPLSNNSPIRIQFGFRGWAAIAFALAILAAAALLAVSVFVLLLPALLIAPILYWLMPKPKPRPLPSSMNFDVPRPSIDTEIIEGDFTVVSDAPIERKIRSPGENKL
jgi:hypothetical protein